MRLLLSLLLIGSVFSVYSITNKGTRDMDLYGDLDHKGARSIVVPSVTALQSDDAVILNFTKAVGSVNISVSSENEVVYLTALDITEATQFSISTGGFEVGTYLLEITKPVTNGRVYGEFIIE